MGVVKGVDHVDFFQHSPLPAFRKASLIWGPVNIAPYSNENEAKSTAQSQLPEPSTNWGSYSGIE